MSYKLNVNKYYLSIFFNESTYIHVSRQQSEAQFRVLVNKQKVQHSLLFLYERARQLKKYIDDMCATYHIVLNTNDKMQLLRFLR